MTKEIEIRLRKAVKSTSLKGFNCTDCKTCNDYGCYLNPFH